MDVGIGQGGVDAALAAQMNTHHRSLELLQASIAAQLFKMGQWPLDMDCAGQRGLTGQSLDVRHPEQCVDIELRKVEGGLGEMFAVKQGLAVCGERGGFKARGEVVGQGMIGGVGGDLNCAHLFAAEGQSAEGSVALKIGIARGS